MSESFVVTNTRKTENGPLRVPSQSVMVQSVKKEKKEFYDVKKGIVNISPRISK